jgi:hypothetical protein
MSTTSTAYPQGAQYGNELDDANGGLGDELDSISLRDVAAVRYVRHHEWLELALGTVVPSSRIAPPKVIPQTSQPQGTGVQWSFSDSESIKAKVDSLQAEIDELQEQNAKGWSHSATVSTGSVKSQAAEKADFYRRMIAKLREDFGTVSADSEYESKLINELESKFKVSVIERKRVRRVGTSFAEPVEQPQVGPQLPEDMDVDQGNDMPLNNDLLQESDMPSLGENGEVADLYMGDANFDDANALNDVLNIHN